MRGMMVGIQEIHGHGTTAMLMTLMQRPHSHLNSPNTGTDLDKRCLNGQCITTTGRQRTRWCTPTNTAVTSSGTLNVSDTTSATWTTRCRRFFVSRNDTEMSARHGVSAPIQLVATKQNGISSIVFNSTCLNSTAMKNTGNYTTKGTR